MNLTILLLVVVMVSQLWYAHWLWRRRLVDKNREIARLLDDIEKLKAAIYEGRIEESS